MRSNLYSTNFSQFCTYGSAVIMKILENGVLEFDDDVPPGIISELKTHGFITFKEDKPSLTERGKKAIKLGGLGEYYITQSNKKPWWVTVLTWKPKFLKFRR